MAPVPECLACGTCCFSHLATFVAVSGDDYARLGDHVDALVSFDGVHAHMRMVDGHCGALEVDARSGQFVCTVYAARPQVCRDLARGSGACSGERAAKAERPVIALRLAAAHPTRS